jgi:GNAT superfamily N-acetyltransferase
MELLYEGTAGTGAFRLTEKEEVDAIIDLFAAIARQETWCPGENLFHHRDRSVYLAGVQEDSIVGGIQLVLGETQRPLPFVSIWQEICAPRCPSAGHVLILALDKDHRGRLGLFGLLSLSLWRECKARGIDDLWLEATPAKLKVYRRLGWPLFVRGELREH